MQQGRQAGVQSRLLLVLKLLAGRERRAGFSADVD